MRLAGLFPFFLLLAALPGAAFVTLETSGRAVPEPGAPASPPLESMPAESTLTDGAPSAARRSEFPRLGTVLFVSGDDMRVFAVSGLLRALEEYGLEPELIVAEGLAALPALGFALGHPMEQVDSLLRAGIAAQDIESSAPHPRWDEEDRMWQLPLPDFGSRQARPFRGCSADISLSWRVARLLRAASPEARERAAGKLAFQVAEAATGQPRLVRPGDWQDLVKASLASPGCRVGEWVNGATVSLGTPLPHRWPFLLDRVAHLRLPGKLQPGSLDGSPAPAGAAMARRWSEAAQSGLRLAERLELDMRAEGGLPGDSAAVWEQMGYRAGLRSMDALRTLLRPRPDSIRAGGGGVAEARLWQDGAVDPEGQGSFQLLRQRLRQLSSGGHPDAWLEELRLGGFYPDLDLKWLPPARGEEEGLVFSGSERPRVEVAAGAAYKVWGQPWTRQFPEGMAHASWAEPHYLPFKVEAAFRAGGARSGWGGQVLAEPPWPFWTRLSFYGVMQTHRFEPPTAGWRRAGALDLALREEVGALRASFGFSARNYAFLEARRQALRDLEPDPDDEDHGYEAVDFTAGLRHARGSPRGWSSRLELSATRMDPVELPGLVREPHFVHRGALALGWRGAEAWLRMQLDEARETPWRDVYDRWVSGRNGPLSFGSDLFFERWTHVRYGQAGGAWSFAWKALGLRAAAGAAGYQVPDPDWVGNSHYISPFWEASASLATFLGPWRLAAGGFGSHGPFLALQWGLNFDLERRFLESEL